MYPKLRKGGGYQFLKCIPNSRKLELLPPDVYNSPFDLKRRAGTAITYIRPIQKNLSIEFHEDSNVAEVHILI